MARALRIEYEGAIYHVMARGNLKQAIFCIEERLAFLRRYAWSSHRDYGGVRNRFDWLMRGPLLDLVSEGRADREVAYRQYVERGAAESDEELNAAMARSSKAIGGAEFCSWADEEYRRVQMQQGRQEDVAMRRRDVVLSPDAVRDAVALSLKLPVSELSLVRGNSFARDLLIISWRDFCGLTNREIGHRLGHADGATVGKRFAQLSSDADLRHGIQKAVVKVKKCSIDNCKA